MIDLKTAIEICSEEIRNEGLIKLLIKIIKRIIFVKKIKVVESIINKKKIKKIGGVQTRS